MAVQHPPVSPPTGAEASHPPTDVREVRRGLSPVEAQDYLGDAACAECHKSLVERTSTTRHASTLREATANELAPAFAVGNRVVDRKRHLSYRAALVDNQCVVTASDGANQGALRPDYVMGSGRNAWTFFAVQDPNRFMKLRISYYTRAKEWGFTPTLLERDPIDAPAGGIERDNALEGCLLCHVTVLIKEGGLLNLPASALGIGCERCHGPGRPHVERIRASGRDQSIERLGAAAPARINKICGACHRNSDNAAFADPHSQRQMPRFQGLALEQSRCYRKSGRLSCVSCHDPHSNSNPALEHSDRVCGQCHKASHSPCKLGRKTDCTNCHMPEQRISTIPHAQYRNHWIKVWAESPAQSK